jgi:hypothetical protein
VKGGELKKDPTDAVQQKQMERRTGFGGIMVWGTKVAAPPPLQFKENTGGLGGLGWIRHRLVKSVGPHTEGLVSIYKTIHMLFSWITIKLKRCGLHKWSLDKSNGQEMLLVTGNGSGKGRGEQKKNLAWSVAVSVTEWALRWTVGWNQEQQIECKRIFRDQLFLCCIVVLHCPLMVVIGLSRSTQKQKRRTMHGVAYERSVS